MEYARKLELLLEMFPRSDGRVWRGSDIEHETKGRVSQSYFSQLRTGRWARPGLEQLAAIAEVMGFPFELWRTDPKQWQTILDKQTSGDWYLGTSKEVAAKLTALCDSVLKPDGQPYSDEEVAEKSGGRLSARVVRNIREGTASRVTYDQILALSDVFGVDFEYWKQSAEDAAFIFDEEMMEALKDEDNQLLMHRTRNLSKAHKNMLLILAEQMHEAQRSEETGDER